MNQPTLVNMAVDMPSYELADLVIEAIQQVHDDPAYEFRKDEFFHVRPQEDKDIVVVDASGAFFAKHLNFPRDINVSKPSEFKDNLLDRPFHINETVAERLTMTCISEMDPVAVFLAHTIARRRIKLKNMTTFELPDFKTFNAKRPEQDFDGYIAQLKEFREYLATNPDFVEWEHFDENDPDALNPNTA